MKASCLRLNLVENFFVSFDTDDQSNFNVPITSFELDNMLSLYNSSTNLKDLDSLLLSVVFFRTLFWIMGVDKLFTSSTSLWPDRFDKVKSDTQLFTIRHIQGINIFTKTTSLFATAPYGMTTQCRFFTSYHTLSTI